MHKLRILFFSLVGFLFSFGFTSAHEAYVLPHQNFWEEMRGPASTHTFDALKDPNNLHLTILVVSSVLVVLLLNFFFRRSYMGQKLYLAMEKYSHWGPLFVRISIALALFFSALSGSFLGPELAGIAFPFPQLLQIMLFIISIMIFFGIFTELAAFVGILIFVSSYIVFGSYVFTYLNYFGEFLVLMLFGMRLFSFDKYLFGPLRRFKNFEKYETLIVRVFYGLGLIYAAVTVKLLHPEITIDVVNTWHLNQFHWLFPSDPLLIAFGAGIVEMVLGLFIIFGFEMRLAVFVSMFYITLSLFYFREMVWPHLLMYGISINLLIQPETFTLDHLMFKHHSKTKSWWSRPFSPHNTKGKSHKN